MSWITILGLVLLVYAGFVIYRGRLTSGDDYGNKFVVDRAKKSDSLLDHGGRLGTSSLALDLQCI